MTFKEWWMDYPSLDYDEMAAAERAWRCQHKEIDRLKRENKRLQNVIDFEAPST